MLKNCQRFKMLQYKYKRVSFYQRYKSTSTKTERKREREKEREELERADYVYTMALYILLRRILLEQYSRI